MVYEASTLQPRLGKKGLVFFLAALTAFPVLSTDLYLPALPGMTAYFGVPEYQTNLTLTLFFVVFAVAVLVWGPLSDRYGRRPILLVGLACFVVGGALCAVASNVFQLMGFRILQALGTGAASTVATAIVKDVYEGRRREVIIAVIQTMIVISPAVAPVIGALILKFTSWRGAFVAQALLGLLVLAGAVAFRETLTRETHGQSPGFAQTARLRAPQPHLRLPARHLLASQHGGHGVHRLLVVHLPGDVRRDEPGLQLLLRAVRRQHGCRSPGLRVDLAALLAHRDRHGLLRRHRRERPAHPRHRPAGTVAFHPRAAAHASRLQLHAAAGHLPDAVTARGRRRLGRGAHPAPRTWCWGASACRSSHSRSGAACEMLGTMTLVLAVVSGALWLVFGRPRVRAQAAQAAQAQTVTVESGS